MSARVTKLPSIPPVGQSPQQITAALGPLKEIMEVGVGRRGDPLDRFATLRDLTNTGVFGFLGSGQGGVSWLPPQNGQTDVDVPGTVNGLPDNTPPNYGQDDLTPPPMPTGIFVQSIAPNGLMVVFDPPAYGNHAYTEIFLVPGVLAGGNPISLQFFLSLTGTFNPGKPCTGSTSGTNPNAYFVSRCDGSNAVLTLTPAQMATTDNSLGAALNPPVFYVFCRFVSLANISGPFGPQGDGASGHASIDPVRVLDAMTLNVTSSALYANLRSFIGTDPLLLAQLKANGGVTSVFDQTTRNGASIDTLWTVRMAQQLADGTYVSAGFGLGISTDTTTGFSSSIFAVSADTFAIFGTGGNMYNVTSVIPAGGTSTTITLQQSATNRFKIGDTIVIKAAGGGTGGSLDGIEGTITAGTNKIWTVLRNTKATDSVPAVWPAKDSNQYVMTKSTNIPFIVDTATGTVGIRGKLVVDGLIRATQAEFNTMTANTAFINSLRATIINANLVCAQTFIAGSGIDDSMIVGGAIDANTLASINGWIVAISRVQPGGFPFRIYNPLAVSKGQLGSELFAISAGNPQQNISPYMYVNGDFRLGGNAVMNLRQGGAVAMGNKSLDNVAYTMWMGADINYNTGYQNMDNTGFFWMRPCLPGEPNVNGIIGGFNSALFLGKNAFSLPALASQNQQGSTIYQDGSNGPRAQSLVTSSVSASSLTVRGLKDGGVAQTLVMVNGYLASCPTAGGGNGNFKRFKMVARLVNSPTSTSGQVIQQIEMDDYFPEAWDYNLMGIVSVTPGDYWVRIELTNIEDRPMSIVQGWNAVGLQITSNAGLN